MVCGRWSLDGPSVCVLNREGAVKKRDGYGSSIWPRTWMSLAG